MTETHLPELNRSQIGILARLVDVGFQLTNIERITRHVAIEKSGFVALLDPSNGHLELFGSVGYRVGDGIGMLVGQGANSAFVRKKESVEATPQLLATYASVKAELAEILNANPEI